MSESLMDRPGGGAAQVADRDLILDVAAQAFQMHGYEAVSFAELGFDLPTGDDGLRAAFASKYAVAKAVLGERIGAQVQAEWLAPVRDAPDLGQALAQIFRNAATDLESRHRRSGAPIRHLALDLAFSHPDFRVAVDDLFDAWRAAIAERLAKDGHEDPETLATFAVSAFSGVMALARTNQSVGVILAAADQLAERFAQKKPPAQAGG